MHSHAARVKFEPLIPYGFTYALVRTRAFKGLALPRASHSCEIALSGSRRLRATLAAVPFLFAHTFGHMGYQRHDRIANI